MSRATGGASGDFAWVGLLTADVEGAKRFYGELFGWTAEAAAAGGRAYNVMRHHGEQVALVYEVSEWQRALGAPTNWATFVRVLDVDASLSLAARLGGDIAIPPYDAAEAGRIAVVTDPGGARLSLWQSNAHSGPRWRGAVGTRCWNELATDAVDAVASFYAELFGWELARDRSGHVIVANDGIAQGKIRPLRRPDERGSRWLPYFRVTRVGDVERRCVVAGGQLTRPSDDGPWAVLCAPDGACFGVCTRTPAGSGRATAPA